MTVLIFRAAAPTLWSEKPSNDADHTTQAV